MAKARLRVVAGEAGGLLLVAPEGIRPTTERAREAIFSALGGLVVDATVLDLYAGSGAMGIEALSRGAALAIFVDSDRAAKAAIAKNLETTGLSDRGQVVARNVSDLRVGESVSFDLVFCDPPYALPDAELAAVFGSLTTRLTDGARVVVERPAPTWVPPPGWSASWQRRYGDTLVTIVQVSDVAS